MKKNHQNNAIRWFEDLGADDVTVVGGKNASLGEMIRALKQEDIRVPDGFATTSEAYRDERNAAVKQQIHQQIQAAHQADKKVGICGQAPSDYPEFAAFLIQEGIDSISLNPDSVITVKKRVAEADAKLNSAKKS
jgi:phosphoenolpyruvate synthase/pyruvate phosphate dikinase